MVEGIRSPAAGGAGEKKRRLSTDQVRALEKNFEVENKLEPERKAQLAQELGLQPRQVAVWFQNRRARWKTKQLERDYGALKSRYDALRLDYDALLRDKDALFAEVCILPPPNCCYCKNCLLAFAILISHEILYIIVHTNF